MQISDYFEQSSQYAHSDDDEEVRRNKKVNFACLNPQTRANAIIGLKEILNNDESSNLRQKAPLVREIREFSEIDQLLLDAGR
jgi:hypothetical protein